MYKSTPGDLANRVRINVRLFCRRANKNMESITKDMFVIGTLCNEKVDKLTKTHREMDREIVSGQMTEDSEMPEYCPVRNFEIYLEKLHPQCNRLWQFHMNAGSKA